MAKKVLLKIASPMTGDPTQPSIQEEKYFGRSKTPMDLSFDVRDRLSELIGKGNVLNPDEKAGIYRNLVSTLGKDKADKVMNHAFIFNSRSDVQKLPIEEKLKAFYALGSNDPEVTEIISKTKNLGYGVLPGFRSSISQMNQEIAGKTPIMETSAINPELQKRVMLKIKK